MLVNEKVLQTKLLAILNVSLAKWVLIDTV